MKKCLNYLLSFSLIIVSFAANAERITVNEYVDHYRDIAISEMYRSGIPASIKLGQGILESDCGNSVLSNSSNNHFGIKCKKEWGGSTYYHKDDDLDKKGKLIESCFRAYYSSYESYIDHSEFLSNRDRYSVLFSFHHTDYKQWAYGLKAAGYATAKGYAEKLISIIERYDLAKYDYYANPYEVKPVTLVHTFEEGEELMVFGADEVELKEVEMATVEEMKPENTKEPVVAEVEETTVLFPEQAKEYFQINDIVAVSSTGKSLHEVAKMVDVKLSKLLKYNELKNANDLVENQYLFLTKKQKSFNGKTVAHTVKEGETMYILAQRYGIRLRSLRKINRLKKGQEPLVGEIIFLSGKAAKKPKIVA